MEELLASSKNTLSNLTYGQEVEGEVVSKDDKEIILDINAKSEGLLLVKDVPVEALEKIKIGSKLKAFVFEPEGEAGLIVLSYHSLHGTQAGGGRWDRFIQAKRTGSQLNGQATEISGEGVVIEVDGTRGYLPASQMEDPSSKEELVGKRVQVGVLEVDSKNNKLIFMQKGAGGDFDKAAGKYKADQTLKGKVTKITQFGIFVQLEKGIEGLIHISKLGPDDNFQEGQEITVTIDSIDTNKRRIALVPTITSTKGLIYK